MQNEDVEGFAQLVLKNLEKNGFPERPVSFPLERMFEEADKRGFSFNKVRDLLKARGIGSELTDDRVVFSKLDESDIEFDGAGPLDAAAALGMDAGMLEAVQTMFSQMSDQERDALINTVRSMDPAALAQMRQHWDGMPPEEKRRVMEEVRSGPRGYGE